MSLRVGLALPQRRLTSELDPEGLGRFVASAEALGYDGLWTAEQIGGVPFDLAAIPMLAHAAALTTRVRLGTAVLVAPFHEPVDLAKSLATVDRLSGGRLVLGVGIGSRPVSSHLASFGLEPGTRGARLEECVDLLRRLWTGNAVSFEGRFWQIHDLFVSPTPVQPSIPIWFGGHSPPALRRAARLGDGWIGASSTTTEGFREQASLLQAHLAEAHRDLEGFEIAKRVFIAVDRDREAALRQLEPWFDVHGGGVDRARRLAVYGNPDDCAEGLDEIISAGAQTLVLAPVEDVANQAEQLAVEVLPRLSRS